MHTHTHLTRLIILVLFIFAHSSLCSAQRSAVGQNIITSNSIQDIQEYEKDASRLALRYLSQQHHELGIKIPEDIKESIYNALLAVYKSDNKYAMRVRDLGIHTQSQPFYIDYLTVVHADNTAWAVPLDKGQPRTSDETINGFIEIYNLDINKYDDENKSFIVSAYPHVNMNGLAKELSQIEGVKSVVVPPLRTPDHNIIAKRERSTWILIYEKKYLNTNKKTQWSFSVDADGNITFLEEVEINDF